MPVSLQWLSEIVTSSCHILMTGVGSEWPCVSLGEWNPGKETAGHGKRVTVCLGDVAVTVPWPCNWLPGSVHVKSDMLSGEARPFSYFSVHFLSSSIDLIIFPKTSNKKMEEKNKLTPALLKVQDSQSPHEQWPSHSHSNECHEVPKAAFYSFKDSWKESQPLDAA